MKAVRAHRGRGFYAPRYSPSVLKLLRIIGVPYLRYAEGVAGIRTEGMERLYQAYRAFQKKETRLIILFRHVAKEDAPVLVSLFSRELPRWCRRESLSLEQPAFAHFLYGKDVLNWAGAGARWLFPRIGAIPVQNARVDRDSQRMIRETLLEGRFPLCFAPERQVTYHSFRTSALSGGTATFAAWTCKDLRSRGDVRPVQILPISLTYLPSGGIEENCWKLLRRLNGELGRRGELGGDLDRELLSAAAALADFMEASYSAEYPGLIDFSQTLPLQERFDRLLDGILRCAEAAFGWEGEGAPLERIFKIRYRIMESLYREDVDPSTLSSLERSRADYQAHTAALLKRHEETADVLEYVHIDYLEHPGPLRRLEFVLNLLDVLNRMRGGNIDSRYSPPKKQACISIGEPLSLTEAPNRKEQAALSKAISRVYADLGRDLERSISTLL